MKIIRHTARDMRQAMRAVREQLGEDAVILSSRRTEAGVEVTAAVDFEATNLESAGFADTAASSGGATERAPAGITRALAVVDSTEPNESTTPMARKDSVIRVQSQPQPVPARAAERRPIPQSSDSPSRLPLPSAEVEWISPAARDAVVAHARQEPEPRQESNEAVSAPPVTTPRRFFARWASGRSSAAAPRKAQSAVAASGHSGDAQAREDLRDESRVTLSRASLEAALAAAVPVLAPAAASHSAPLDAPEAHALVMAAVPTVFPAPEAPSSVANLTAAASRPASDSYEAAAEDTGAVATAPDAALRSANPEDGNVAPRTRAIVGRTELPVFRGQEDRSDSTVEEALSATLAPFGTTPVAAAGSTPGTGAGDAMGQELKTLRRMLETQLAHLAWNDRMRRAPIHTEILRELTEIGLSHDLAELLVNQLPDDTDLIFARRFTIAGLSQYLRVTGDRWLEEGGRVAFAGATGVGKTTTLAKVAVRWVLRHGARDVALVAADSVRIGAQDQLQALGQLVGVPVYVPERFEALPALLARLHERLVLIDTPGSSTRDATLGARLAVLAERSSRIETALVLSASMQAGALEEAVRRFAPASPACCVLTKLDEAASLGGLLSVLIRQKLPVAYVSEGQRVPEDLRPARALELVSSAVQLAKASGAAADEDLLRRRFGTTAHGA